MKALQSSLLRSAAAIVVGVLLVVYREETMKWMTIAMGAMFLLTGLVSCLVYYFERGRVEKAMLAAEARGEEFTERRPMVPIVGLGPISGLPRPSWVPTNDASWWPARRSDHFRHLLAHTLCTHRLGIRRRW